MTWAVYSLYGLMGLSLYRLFAGPSLYDRLIAVHLVSAEAILLLCVHAIRAGRPFYLDVAMLAALLSFVETIAFARMRPRRRGEKA